MRWLFPAENDVEENASRKAVLSRIDAWWQAFMDNIDQLSANPNFDVAAFMREHLEAIDHNLRHDLNAENRKLAITPESAVLLRPLCDAIIARAPQDTGWEFFHGRQALEVEDTRALIEARTGSPVGRCKINTSVSDLNTIDLHFYLPDAPSPDVAEAHAQLATESLLGEEAFARWVGRIHVEEQEEEDRWVPLDALKRNVFSDVAGVISSLPERPLFEIKSELKWSLWRLSPTKKDDYTRHEDLIMGNSALDSMSGCAQLGLPFDSQRYSRCHELFVYLKIDGHGKKMKERMADRQVVEKRLDALVDEGLGIVVGAGTGWRYSYLDIALADVPNGVNRIRELAKELKVDGRSWLLFHDQHLGAEWQGTYKDTPPPP
ncbi:MAG: hypothetical protein ACYTDT_00450 [Planctomycetota bacterium]|jgi:hypothetical protein